MQFWPQYAYIALTVFGLGVVAAKHGERREPYSFWLSSVATVITFTLLHIGGFFKGML